MTGTDLRKLLAEAIMRLVQPQRGVDQPGICDRLGLPDAPDNPELTKRQYVAIRLEKMHAVPVAIAENFVEMYPVASGERASFAIEEILWSTHENVVVNEKHRRLLARALDGFELALDGRGFMRALDKLWILDSDPILALLSGPSFRKDIEQHVVRNPGDWPVEHLFNELGAFDCTDRRFAAFIEALVSHQVRPDEDEQRRFQTAVNDVVRSIGVELRETGTEGGYPVFALCSTRTPTGRPKNLIFASLEKPDLRFSDAVNNDVEILSHADDVLIYDRPIHAEGLTWQDLQNWWADEQGLPAEEAKATLYRRLQSCLPESSPPQRLLFDAYHRTFKSAVPSLPALLPEVWLHYDPVTVRKRGRDALFRQRMDFLLLLSSHARVVIEVDGKHHFEDEEIYAKTMRADRELRLVGYEVYRFGASELHPSHAEPVVGAFFRQLFERHGVDVPD